MRSKLLAGFIALSLSAMIGFFISSDKKNIGTKHSFLKHPVQSAQSQQSVPHHHSHNNNASEIAAGQKTLPDRLPTAIEEKTNRDSDTDSKVREFLKGKTKQNWTLEKNKTNIEKIFGGEVKELVNTDEKLTQFISELTMAMGYEDLQFNENKTAQKKSDYEVINEFQQNIGTVEIYGGYFRAFRDSDNLNASFFINEFKKYDRVVNQEIFTVAELESKIDTYYGRLGKTVKQQKCDQKVYFVGEQKTAELAYRCLINTASQMPETFEVIVSATSSDILFQKRITIFN